MDLPNRTKLHHVDKSELEHWVESVLQKVRIPLDDAHITAHVLVDADLTGRHTHGVSRLPLYVTRIEQGLMAPHPKFHWESLEHPSMARLDGGNGLGPVVAWHAIEHAITLAKDYGSSIISVFHSNHCGAMSVYCEEAARHGMIALALTNSPPGIPPWGGREAYFGTNPIAWGFPRGGSYPPLVIDLATSVVARGNIIQAARLNQPIPLGWAIDSDGHPTTDARAALEGAVLPIGGAKGYALALAVEVLTGVLSGAGVGPTVKSPYTDISGPSDVGHFFMVFNPEGILPSRSFSDRLLIMEEEVRNVPPTTDSPVAIPGDRSERKRVQYTQKGIPLDHDLIDQLNSLALRLGLQSLGGR